MTTITRPPQRIFAAAIPMVVLLAALLTMIGVGLLGVGLARTQLDEVRTTKGAAVAEAVRRDLARALGHGIPLERIEGVGPYLQAIGERNADLGFLAVTGREGVVLHESGIGREALERLAATLRGTAEPPEGSTGALPVERDGFLIVRLPLGGPSGKEREVVGHVLVGVRSGQGLEQSVRDAIPVVLGMAAVLLLLLPVAAATTRGALGGPLDRLARRMAAAAQGDFGTLIDRRPRDQMGRVQLAFNAVVFQVHDRRQRFAAQADEVRGAVFDPEVAQEVEHARQRTLEALGPGLTAPPRRVADARAEDCGAYIAVAMAAAVAAVLAAAPLGGWAAMGASIGAAMGAAVPVAVVSAVAAVAAGAMPAVAIRSAAAVASMAIGAAAVLPAPWAPWPGLLAAAAGGVAVGLALRYARVRAGGGPAVVLRAAAGGGGAAVLWGAALDWSPGGLAVTALALALAAAPLARSFVPLRR